MESKILFSNEIVEKISSRYSEDSLIKDRRLKALEIFHQLPEPKFRYGISITLDISGLDLNKINPLEISERDTVEIKAEKPVIVEDIRKAITSIPDVREYFMKAISVDNKIDAFTAAFWQNGKVVYVPKGTVLKKPIEIVSKIDSGNMMEYVLIIVDDSSEVTIIEDLSSETINTSKGEVCFSGKLAEIVVKENSIMHYASIQNLGMEFFNFVKKRAIVGADSTLNWLDCCLGSRYTRADIITRLSGRGSSTNNYGLFFGTGSQQFDLNVGTIHAERNTVCDMMTKGALNDRAKAVYTGLVKINANAANSNGYQKEDTLLLSPDAEADSIPQLEIDNNEVKCTHGATVGQVDKEKLFYLMSRGIPANESKKILVEGFFEPMIQKIAVENVQNKLREIVAERVVIR